MSIPGPQDPADKLNIPERTPAPPAPPAPKEEWETIKPGIQREKYSGRLRTSNDPWRRG